MTVVNLLFVRWERRPTKYDDLPSTNFDTWVAVASPTYRLPKGRYTFVLCIYLYSPHQEEEVNILRHDVVQSRNGGHRATDRRAVERECQPGENHAVGVAAGIEVTRIRVNWTVKLHAVF